MEYDKQDCPFYCFPGAVIEQEKELSTLKDIVREIATAIHNSETYGCPMGGRAFCLSPHIIASILYRPEVQAIIKEGSA